MRCYSSVLIIIFMSLTAVLAQAQAPDTLWTRTFGGTNSDKAMCVRQTSDGGFIITGKTESYGVGGSDAYWIKTDANGDTVWTRTCGGHDYDIGYSVEQTIDGYIIAGYSESFNPPYSDVYLIKTYINGDTAWTRTYGGTYRDNGYSVRQTPDGGYIIAGSWGHTNRNSDVYLIKTDAIGDTFWTRIYGGAASEGASSVNLTTDGGYIIGGTAGYSAGGASDVLLMKIDSVGNTVWTRTYDEADVDGGSSAQQTSDGGYIVAGITFSVLNETYDVYLIKTDADGDTLWTRKYGNAGYNLASSVQQTSDGGYIIAGTTITYGLNRYDFYVIKTDADGDTLWTRIFGGCFHDEARSVQQTQDGGYIVAGYTGSFGAGDSDVWLIKLDAQGSPLNFTLIPHNPPIRINAGGGSFSFDAVIENLTANPVNFDAWTEVVLPNGSVQGPLLHRSNLTIPSGAVLSRELSQTVPGYAPAGDYTYIGNIGFYPDSVMDTDNFPFEKRTVLDGAGNNRSWEIFGWDDCRRVRGLCDTFNASPNPFNASTAISYKLQAASNVNLAVYDVSGREVALLAEGYHPAGTYQVEWDASGIPSGVYFARLTAEGTNSTLKLLLIK